MLATEADFYQIHDMVLHMKTLQRARDEPVKEYLEVLMYQNGDTLIFANPDVITKLPEIAKLYSRQSGIQHTPCLRKQNSVHLLGYT